MKLVGKTAIVEPRVNEWECDSDIIKNPGSMIVQWILGEAFAVDANARSNWLNSQLMPFPPVHCPRMASAEHLDELGHDLHGRNRAARDEQRPVGQRGVTFDTFRTPCGRGRQVELLRKRFWPRLPGSIRRSKMWYIGCPRPLVRPGGVF